MRISEILGKDMYQKPNRYGFNFDSFQTILNKTYATPNILQNFVILLQI